MRRRESCPDRITRSRTIGLVLMFASLVLCIQATDSAAHTFEEEEFTCPLCGTKFKAIVDCSGTVLGRRLDLKPLGAIAAPWRKPVCPACHFVLYSEQEKPAEDIGKLRKIVGSEEYKKLVREGHTSYFLWGTIREKTGADHFDTGWTFLQASWQVEGKSNRYNQYISRALVHLEEFARRRKPDDERWPVSMHLAGELMRLLGRFDKAEQHFTAMQKEPTFSKQPYRTLLTYELELIAGRDKQPHEAPEIELTEEDKKDTPSYKKCASLAGFAKMTRRFKIEKTRIRHFNETSRGLVVRLEGLDERPINEAVWHNPMEGDQPRFDWNDFLETFDRINEVATRHPWLSAWQTESEDRRIEAHIIGEGELDALDLEHLVLPPWNHAGLKGDPRYKLLLLEGKDEVATIYLSGKEKKALMTSLKKPKGMYGFEVLYHPADEVPQYIIVEPDGTKRKNSRPK